MARVFSIEVPNIVEAAEQPTRPTLVPFAGNTPNLLATYLLTNSLRQSISVLLNGLQYDILLAQLESGHRPRHNVVYERLCSLLPILAVDSTVDLWIPI